MCAIERGRARLARTLTIPARRAANCPIKTQGAPHEPCQPRASVGIDPVARARDLGPEIEAAADEIERTQAIPEPLLTHIHEARLARMLLPRSVGGDQLDPWTYLHAIEEISRHDGSVGWNLFVANSAALIAPFIPLETAKAIFADPRALDLLGTAQPIQGARGTGRLSGQRRVAFRQRQPAGHLDGRALPGDRAGRVACG